jgi:hypothetical protein
MKTFSEIEINKLFKVAFRLCLVTKFIAFKEELYLMFKEEN